MLSRREALAELARAAGSRPASPRDLRATAVRPHMVGLAWKPVHGRQIAYEVFRDGRRIARARRPHFKDRKVRPNTAYRYAVAARAGRLSGRHSVKLIVHTPAGVRTGPTPPGVPAPTAPKPAPPPGWPDPTLTQPMVDRLFWRAGFGPTDSDRQQWTGQPASALIEHFLSTPYSLASTSTPPRYLGNPIDPLASDPELMMEWLDRMQRAANPFVERMNFFWHRHWAVSRDEGIPSSMLLAYRDRLRRYSDFQANPGASFKDLALEMTTQDAAMSLYLTGYLNRKQAPNENYAREFMELFTLGATDASARPNYSQTDVHELARAFTGYSLDFSSGQVALNPAYADTGVKSILGSTGRFNAPAAVDVVLAQRNHGPFLVNKLWSEFIAAPIPADALASLACQYISDGYQLAPLLRDLLRHPLMFDSIGEPTMIKSPVLYTVGVLRALGAPLRDTVQTNPLRDMQQQPYHPPNVAGWEGGRSWMTTSTAVARFQLVAACQKLLPPPADVPGESPQAAFDRAYGACGSPWLSDQTRSVLLSYAQQAPARTASLRADRYTALCELILGGPDGQVL